MKWRDFFVTNRAQIVDLVVATGVAIISVVILMAAATAIVAVTTSLLVEFGNYLRGLKGL